MAGRNTSLRLTRLLGEVVVLRVGDEVVRVTVAAVDRNRVELRFEAARHVQINREEVDIVKFSKDTPPEV